MSVTTNGENALSGTNDATVDLFYNIGASRHNQESIGEIFKSAVNKDPLIASAIVAWGRDVRKGAGERTTFRNLLNKLVYLDKRLASKLIDMIPSIGRFDDLRAAFDTDLENQALGVWSRALKDNNELAFKWVNIKKDHKLRRFMKLNKENFRKKIVAGRPHIIETKMCKNQWGEIVYNHVPSVCMNRSNKAFRKHDDSRFEQWINDKTTKVNTSALYPYHVYKTYQSGEVELASKQWANMKLDVSANIIPVIDVSGSMSSTASGSVSCMDVAISLGVYLAQKNTGAFKNKVVTFSDTSEVFNLPETENIGEIFDFVQRMEWGMSTNFYATYHNILDEALRGNVKADRMPEYIVVLSDMQFNEAQSQSCGWGRKTPTMFLPFDTAYQKMEKEFSAAGYKIPKVVFWNLNASFGNFPASQDQENVCLVSGFSPFVMEAIASANLKKITPQSIMMSVIQPYIDVLM